MNARKNIIALAITTALAVGQSVFAQEPAQDSAYQWGRWAVLSPAAGGEPFRAPDAPGSDFNARPSDADAFQPEVGRIQSNVPIVVPNPPGNQPPIGDPRGGGPGNEVPVVVPNPGQPPSGGPRGT